MGIQRDFVSGGQVLFTDTGAGNGLDVDEFSTIVAPPLVASVLSFVFILYLKNSLAGMKTGKDIGAPLVDQLAERVKSGSRAFLQEEYKVLVAFVVVLACCLGGFFGSNPIKDAEGNTDASDGGRIVAVFLFGALLSGSAGWMGMMVATDGNSRTTAACTVSLNQGLSVAFTAGA